MSTEIEICNSALAKIGVEPIASFSEESKAARLCANQYPLIRDKLLQDHYWNFAIKTEQLAQLAGGSSIEGYRFALPTDYYQAIRLTSRKPYKIESGVLIVKEEAANLKYVWKNHNTFSYTPLFKEALASALAFDLSYSLVQSVSLRDRLERTAFDAKLNAASVDAQEDYMDNLYGDDFIESRYGEVQSFNK